MLGGGFVDATDKIDALLTQPEIAAFIESERPARAAMNAACALNLRYWTSRSLPKRFRRRLRKPSSPARRPPATRPSCRF